MADNHRLIVFDGAAWHVRTVRLIEHDIDANEKVYRCDKSLGNDYATLADVPLVKAAIAESHAKLRERLGELEKRWRKARVYTPGADELAALLAE